MKKKILKQSLILSSLLLIYSCSEDLQVEENANANTLSAKSSTYAKSGDLLYSIKGETIEVLPKNVGSKDGFYIVSKHSYRALTIVDKTKQIEQTDHVFPNNEYTRPSSRADITIDFEGNTIDGTRVYRIQWGNLSTRTNSFWEVSSKDGGAPVTTQASRLGDSQKFVFEPTGDPDNSVYIRNLDTGKYLQVAGNAENNIKSGGVLEQQPLARNQGQRFLILTTNTGSEDSYLKYKEQAAVKINGQIWMKNILGDNRVNPNVGPYNQFNYYQYGHRTPVANATTAIGTISNWNNVVAPTNAWNLGTEANPIKNTTNDPCPTGYRVPTAQEINTLIESTTGSIISGFNAGSVGTWTPFDLPNSMPENYSAARVLKSRKDSNIELVFPATGIRQWNDGKLYLRGYQGNYWTSTHFGTGTSRFLNFRKTGNLLTDLGSTNAGYPIRCIAEN
jgi:uncharacterized protein (TIGR02145 family)